MMPVIMMITWRDPPHTSWAFNGSPALTDSDDNIMEKKKKTTLVWHGDRMEEYFVYFQT